MMKKYLSKLHCYLQFSLVFTVFGGSVRMSLKQNSNDTGFIFFVLRSYLFIIIMILLFLFQFNSIIILILLRKKPDRYRSNYNLL